MNRTLAVLLLVAGACGAASAHFRTSILVNTASGHVMPQRLESLLYIRHYPDLDDLPGPLEFQCIDTEAPPGSHSGSGICPHE